VFEEELRSEGEAQTEFLRERSFLGLRAADLFQRNLGMAFGMSGDGHVRNAMLREQPRAHHLCHLRERPDSIRIVAGDQQQVAHLRLRDEVAEQAIERLRVGQQPYRHVRRRLETSGADGAARIHGGLPCLLRKMAHIHARTGGQELLRVTQVRRVLHVDFDGRLAGELGDRLVHSLGV
jgi:hypothetical protein